MTDLQDALARIDQVAAQDRADRANPNTARMVDARDLAAAGGRFTLADASDRLIDSVRAQDADRAADTRSVSPAAREEGVER